uniref:Prephenate/arogenate dehydrogenase domain-containing protein n=1 Tax=Cajanus cajan TaxID=3821 RepID=A0A151SLM3_CAJCA|nr:hypothetical protein KK1_001864 [Cajanus cajan]
MRVSTFQAPSLNPSPSLPPSIRRLKLHNVPNAVSSHTHRPLRIRAMDAAQPFDYESRVAQQFHDSQKLKIAIVGFGNFGQFLAQTLVRQGHTVLAHSRSDHSRAARQLGVTFFANPHDLCEEHPEVILLCSSIISTQRVLLTLPLQRLKRSTLFVDVLSVKEFPKTLLLHALPSDFDILCSHPMFGPESASHAWTGLPFVFEKVRIADEDHRLARVDKFLDVFAREGCRMVEMSCAEHDRFAAGSQFITHTVGRVLEMLMLESTPINTKGYESLLNLVDNTARDSFDLYYGLFGDVGKLVKYNSNGSHHSDDKPKLKIAIVGFGNFGQFLAKTIVRLGHQVLAYSRSDYSHVAQELGVSYFNNVDDLCEQHPEVILLCTSILSTEKVLKSLPMLRLKRSTLFVDVLSVKEFPRNLFLQHLSPDFDVLCTHPMFGPESGKNGWNGLPFVYDKVRVGTDEARMSRCDRFLEIFSSEGCRMVEMTCAEHDWHAAGSQFITHTTGRFLEKLKLEATPIDTKGYETLLSLVENTAGDSFDLYYGLFLYNINAMEQLERFDLAFESLKKQLFDRLHDVYRKQVFKYEEKLHDFSERSMLLRISEDNNPGSSFSNTVDNK